MKPGEKTNTTTPKKGARGQRTTVHSSGNGRGSGIPASIADRRGVGGEVNRTPPPATATTKLLPTTRTGARLCFLVQYDNKKTYKKAATASGVPSSTLKDYVGRLKDESTETTFLF